MHDASPGTQVFLFTDIEGSTRLEQAVGTARYGEVRERHRAILRAAFAAHAGSEQGTEGDSFFVVFTSAREAVLAALEAQRGLAGEPWPADVEVRVRMGLHAGEASLAGDTLVGLDINRTARIAAAANGGQIVVSETIRALAGSALSEGLGFRSLGSHRLKDLREPEPLYQVVGPGLPETFPPLRSIDARPNNLPTQLTSFVGREMELAESGRLLEANRLVTLTGPGGTGKTRLSLQVAANAAKAYPDGIFFVPLETVREPNLVPGRITAAIGLAESSRTTPLALLRDWLVGKKVLLVLDNLEQVLEAGPLVADLLRTAAGLSVLVTSRAPLRVSGEQEYPVPGLPTPPDLAHMTVLERTRLGQAASILDPEALSTYEAVRLFIARASAVRPGFAITNDNAPAVAAITTRLHGMPLAIELAAARVKLLTPDAILQRLEHQLGLLASGSRDLPERQQTLRGAIAWSYELLDAPCRRLLDRLSVFAGSFELGAAEQTCGPADEIGQEVIDGLMSLVDQSLVKAVDGEGEPRYGLLETIREFAAERLEASGERAEIERRHAAWYLDFARRAAPELSGDDQRAWLERYEAAHDNVRAVLDRAVAAEDPEIAIGLAFACWRFWQKRGHLDEARRRLEAMAGAAWSRREPRLRARLVEALGGICWWQGDLAAMGAAYGEAVEIWRTLDDPSELANALYNFAFAYSVPDQSFDTAEVDRAARARAILEEALSLYRAIGDERGEANVLWGIGNSQFFGHAVDAGTAQFRLALEKFRRVGDRTMEAWSLHMLGGALTQLGKTAEARPLLAEALRHFHDASDTTGLPLVLDDLSQVAVADGDLERAARLRGAARHLQQATGADLAGIVDDAWDASAQPTLHRALPADQLERLLAEGAAMPLDEAIAYALGGSPATAAPNLATDAAPGLPA